VFETRAATRGDAAGIARLSAAVGQTGAGTGADARYLELLLANGTAVVAVDGDAVLGWGALRTLRTGAVLTDLFVDPARHGAGIGAAILGELWPDHAAPARLTFSSQHVNALPLYLRFGLRPVWPLLYLTGRRERLPESSCQVEDVPVAAAAMLEERFGGGDRRADYEYWARLPGHRLVAVHGASDAIGVGVLGPAEVVRLAGSADAAPAALRAVPAEVVACCVPGPHPATTTLVGAGFRPTDYDLAMTTPDVALPTTWLYSAGLA
jgi:GNAT superfamily N-acetyltransferase